MKPKLFGGGIIKRTAFGVAFFTALATSYVEALTPLYWGGGTVGITGGTAIPRDAALLGGTWNLSTTNWALDPAGAAYSHFDIGDDVVAVMAYATNATAAVAIRVTENINLANLIIPMQTPATTASYLFTNAGAASKIMITGNPAGIYVEERASGLRTATLFTNVLMEGSGPLAKYGAGKLNFIGKSTNYTGTIHVRAGTLSLDKLDNPSTGGALGSQNLIVRGETSRNQSIYSMSRFPTPDFNIIVPAGGAQNALPDDAAITLARGTFQYTGSRNNNEANISTETIGKIILEPQGFFEMSGFRVNGSFASKLILSDPTNGLDRGSTGQGTLYIVSSPTTDVVVANGLVTETLIPWIGAINGELYRVNASSKVFERIAQTAAPADLSAWVEDADYLIASRGNSFFPENSLGSIAINSLGICMFNTTNITITDGDKLTINAGVISDYRYENGTTTFTGGSLTSGTNELYLHVGHAYGKSIDLNIRSVITGENMDVIKAGLGRLIYSGTNNNTYSGVTYINSGEVQFSKTNSQAVAGPVVVRHGASLYVTGSTNQIPSTADITLEAGAGFSMLNNLTLSSTLTINGGSFFVREGQLPTLQKSGFGLAFNGGRITRAGQDQNDNKSTLSLQTDVSYASGSTEQALWTYYHNDARRWASASLFEIELDGGNRTFHIADSDSLPAGTPEMVMHALITDGSPAGGRLTKTGAGTLQLTRSATNSYTGGTIINDGTLHVANYSAPAFTGLSASINGSASTERYVQNNIITFHAPVATNFVFGQPVSGTGLTTNLYILEVMDAHRIQVNLANTARESADIAVGAINRSGDLGRGPVTINEGVLLVDAGITITNTATLGGGSFILNGSYNGSLSMTNGTLGGAGTVVQSTTVRGTLAPGADEIGTFYFSSDLTMDSGATLSIQLSDPLIDLVDVGGSASITGTLQVVNTDLGLDPGLIVTVLTASAVSGTFDTLDLPALDSGYAWQVNYDASSVTLEIVTSGPSAPTVGPVTFHRAYGEGLKIAITNLMTNSFDAGGGPLSLSWISTTSSNGHPVTTNDVWLFYTPPVSSNETDYINFRLANTNGIEAESTATILVDPPLTNTVMISSAIVTNGGVVSFSWAGIPGRSNNVQGATMLEPGNWSNIGYQVLSGIGQATFRETNPPSPRYYRITE